MEAAAVQGRRLLAVGGGLNIRVPSSSLCEDPDLQTNYIFSIIIFQNRNAVFWNTVDVDSISFHADCC